jgi:hypothetical protein
MKKISVTRRGLALWFAGIVGLGCLVSGLVFAADAAGDAPNGAAAERFAQLDAATEQVLNEVAALGAQMAVLEEARQRPPKTQLMVLVSVEPSPLFQLQTVQLKIDGNGTAFHQYTQTELAALQRGGSHRLFWDSLPAGRHSLTVSMMGRMSKGPDFQRESTMNIISGVGRRVVELRLSSDKNEPFPKVLLKEWK